jgi:hypothetical protein
MSPAVEAALTRIAERNGRPPPAVVNRRPFSYGTSFPLEAVEIRHQDGTRESLIAKRIDWSRLGQQARLAKPSWLFDPVREPLVYERVLPDGEPGPPRLYGWIPLAEGGSLLFVERIEGPVLWQSGDAGVWEEVARWLARNQVRVDVRTDGDVPLVDCDEAHLMEWLGRGRESLANSGSRRRRRALERLFDAYQNAITLLLGLPRAFLHNEFFASNVLLSANADRPRIAAIDWELAGVGPALVDVAALSVGRWSGGTSPRLDEAYREALPAGHRLALDDARFASGMHACRLLLSVRALVPELRGWSAPREHRHDWLREGLEAADSLQL